MVLLTCCPCTWALAVMESWRRFPASLSVFWHRVWPGWGRVSPLDGFYMTLGYLMHSCIVWRLTSQDCCISLYWNRLGGDEGRCDTVSDFTRMLGECLGGGRRGVIVLESGERLREEGSLLSVFTRLQEITGCNVCTIVETRLDWGRLKASLSVLLPCTSPSIPGMSWLS